MHKRQTVENRSALKRFSHGRRFHIALHLLDLQAGERLLDYGTGDGYMLRAVLARVGECELVGFEPEQSMFAQLAASLDEQIRSGKVRIMQNIGELPRARFDKITCLEVLEHLPREAQRAALNNMRGLLKGEGRLIVSVPIEIGLSSLAKNSVRLLMGQTHGNTTAGNVLRSVVGLPIDRGDVAYHYSHIGFDYRDLESVIRDSGWVIETRTFSPVRALGGLLNSQVFYKLWSRR